MSPTLLVQEAGARPPPFEGGERLLVAQHASEPPAELVVRTIRQLATLERSGRTASAAIVAVAPPSAEHDAAARELVLRTLLRHLASADSGELVLFASGASSELRHELLALAGALTPDLAGTHVALRVRFDDAPEPHSSRRNRSSRARASRSAPSAA